MNLKKIQASSGQRLTRLIKYELGIGYNGIQKLFHNKDVKVNGVRVSKDVQLSAGDLVEVYFCDKPIIIVYEDKDLVVVFKPRGVETFNSLENDLKTKVEKQVGILLYAVHRLDVNTEGLVIFAKNEKAKESLDKVIKERKLQKFYLAKVVGVPNKKHEELVAYLKKDEIKSKVYISDNMQGGYDLIKTNYKLISHDEECSILEIELVTGKTHQIRAHLSHIGLPILGDDKYGDFKLNKKYHKKYQCLCAYKLIFHFTDEDYLSKIDGLELCLDKKYIDFL